MTWLDSTFNHDSTRPATQKNLTRLETWDTTDSTHDSTTSLAVILAVLKLKLQIITYYHHDKSSSANFINTPCIMQTQSSTNSNVHLIIIWVFPPSAKIWPIPPCRCLFISSDIKLNYGAPCGDVHYFVYRKFPFWNWSKHATNLQDLFKDVSTEKFTMKR